MRSAWLQMVLFMASSAAAQPSKIGIFDMAASGFDEAFKQGAIDSLATAVAGFEAYSVITRAELNAMLGAEGLKDSLGCDDVSCLAEIGMAAGVDRVIAGTLTKVDTGLLLNLQLINVNHANVENRVSLAWEGSLMSIPDLMGAGAELLVLPGNQRMPGALRLAGVPLDAAVLVDGEPKGIGPVTVEGLTVGPHALRVEAAEHEPYNTWFVVRSGTTGRSVVQLTRVASDPFYAKWWFWTGVAVLVGGGATAGILASQTGNTTMPGGDPDGDPDGDPGGDPGGGAGGEPTDVTFTFTFTNNPPL